MCPRVRACSSACPNVDGPAVSSQETRRPLTSSASRTDGSEQESLEGSGRAARKERRKAGGAYPEFRVLTCIMHGGHSASALYWQLTVVYSVY
jgi:hypothetical protein